MRYAILGEGVSGSHSMRMLSASSWDILWCWRRARSVSMARGGTGPMGLMRRLSPNCCVYQGRILPGLLLEDRCGSCAPT